MRSVSRLVKVINATLEILKVECLGDPNDGNGMSPLAVSPKRLLVAFEANEQE